MKLDTDEFNKLLFVYNANSSWADKIMDGLHKALSPSTYNCNLCHITHGAIAEKKTWKKFRESAPIPIEIMYRDEFEKQYASKFSHRYTFPIVLIIHQNELEVLVSKEEITDLKTAEELIAMLESRWSALI